MAPVARFSLIYALGNVGAFLCFVPLIGLLLPQRLNVLDPADGGRLLSWALLLGAVMASVANIAAGAISDRLLARQGSRLPMVAAGFVLTMASYAALALSTTAVALVASFLLFQLVFNMLFSPLLALATDHLADSQKGRLFGLLGLGLPLAQASTFVIVSVDLPSMGTQLALIGLLAALCLGPLLLAGRSAIDALDPAPAMHAPAQADTPLQERAAARGLGLSRDFMLAWSARLLVQCAATAMGSYLFLHLAALARVDPTLGTEEQMFGTLSLIGGLVGMATGWALGWASDRQQRRRPFLWVTALMVAAGCALVAVSDGPALLASYALFAIGLAGFLTLDGALIAQLVRPSPRRAAALGFLNLTNTLSAIIVPALALGAATDAALATRFILFGAAIAAAAAAILSALIRSID